MNCEIVRDEFLQVVVVAIIPYFLHSTLYKIFVSRCNANSLLYTVRRNFVLCFHIIDFLRL